MQACFCRCTPHECDILGAHRTHAIYVVYTTRMRFTRCTSHKSSKGAIFVGRTARMRFTRCTPHNSPKERPRCNPRGVHRSNETLSRSPGAHLNFLEPPGVHRTLMGTFGPERVCSLYKFCARTRRRAGWGLLELITELAPVTAPQAAWGSCLPPGISPWSSFELIGASWGSPTPPWTRLDLNAHVLFTFSAPERAAERAGVRARID
jgi:hypothetical protein